MQEPLAGASLVATFLARRLHQMEDGVQEESQERARSPGEFLYAVDPSVVKSIAGRNEAIALLLPNKKAIAR